jgi:hypothetical protein
MTDKKPSPIRGVTPPPQAPEKFWWLVAGEVYFHPVGNPGQIQAANVNAIISTFGPAINGKSLGDAQRGLMQAAVDAAPKDAPVQPVQTTVLSISGLGLMTEEEFFGPKLAEAQ